MNIPVKASCCMRALSPGFVSLLFKLLYPELFSVRTYLSPLGNAHNSMSCFYCPHVKLSQGPLQGCGPLPATFLTGWLTADANDSTMSVLMT